MSNKIKKATDIRTIASVISREYMRGDNPTPYQAALFILKILKVDGRLK